MANIRKSFNFREGVIVDDSVLVVAGTRVGIGTTVPIKDLDVRGDVGVTGLTTTNTLQVIGTSTFLGSVGIGTTNITGAASTLNTAILNTGIVTANSYYGDGSNLNGVSAGELFGNYTGVSTSKNLGIQTNDVNRADLVGAGNSFVGMYLGDGFIGFPTYLGRSGGYYITTSINALNAGPVTLGSTMPLHGAWVIV